MTNHTPNFKDVLESEGMLFLNRMKIYSFSYHCFEMNITELTQNLEQLSNVDFAMKIWDVEKREQQNFIFQEVIRRFHNTVASAKSLVEHTRLFVDEHYKENKTIVSAYRQKVADVFSENGNAAVIEDLRNYFLHAGIPPVQMKLSLDSLGDGKQGVEIKNEVLLDIAELRTWGRWKSRSKTYLAELPATFDLFVLVSEYRATVEAFHAWFSNFLREHHVKDIEELHALDAVVRGGQPIVGPL